MKVTSAQFEIDGYLVAFVGGRIVAVKEGGLAVGSIANPWSSCDAEEPSEITRRRFKPRVTDATRALARILKGAK